MVAEIKLSEKAGVPFSKDGDEMPSALPTSAFVEKRAKGGFMEGVRNFNWWLAFGFLRWYAFNAGYVITNKMFLNAMPLPWTVSAMQLLIGWVFMVVYWGFNMRPAPYFDDRRNFLMTFIPLGALHFFVHVGAVISMGFGSVAFTHIVKALEPVFTAVLSIFFLREFLNTHAYMALVPVIVGVALASAKEMNFHLPAFLFAMLSNASAAARSVLTKITMKNKSGIGDNLTASNIYLILTLLASVMALPFVLFLESYEWIPIWRANTKYLTFHERGMIWLYAGASSFLYYLSNDAAFYCLGEIDQVTYSVANTAKRVVLIGSSILVFKNRVTALGYVGMAIAIVGTFLYSLVK